MHFDEALGRALELFRPPLVSGLLQRAVVVDDIFGAIRVFSWPGVDFSDAAFERLREEFRETCGPFSSSLEVAPLAPVPFEMEALFEKAWEEGAPLPDSDGRLRTNKRHRNRTGWFLPSDQVEPLWSPTQGPPIVVFYSFKGGVGRSTGLAACAAARARRGERIVVVDFDLDAPGVGFLLDADQDGTTANWGVVDFLVEARHALPLNDYFHRCAREPVTGDGQILVFPAGRLDDQYLEKLAKVDVEVGADPRRHPLATLLERVRAELEPSVIFVDARAGLSPAAGLLLCGLAHMHVVFATSSRQSVEGLRRVIARLGLEQASSGRAQSECIVVHAMIPENAAAAEPSRAGFAGDVEEIFRSVYYASDRDPDDRLWSLADIDSSVAPHVPVPISYQSALSYFRLIDDVAGVLADGDYRLLAERIDQRIPPSALDEDSR